MRGVQKRKYKKIVLVDGSGKDWRKNVIKGNVSRNMYDQKTKINMFGRDKVSGSEKVVSMFVDSLFGERIGLLTERWVKYPEDGTKGAFWNINSILSTIWHSEVDLRVDNEFVTFFKQSKTTKIRISELNDQENLALSFIVENRDIFFCASDLSPSGNVTLHGFYYNSIIEDSINRRELLMGMIAKMLYACVDDGFLDMKSIIVTCLNSMIFSYLRETGEVGSTGKKTIQKVTSLAKVLAYVKMPIHVALSEYKRKKTKIHNAAFTSHELPPSVLLGGIFTEKMGGDSSVASARPADDTGVPCTVEDDVHGIISSIRPDLKRGGLIPTSLASKVVRGIKSDGEFAVNSPIYDLLT